jgi:hypothetical protein
VTAVEPASRSTALDSPFPGLTHYTAEYADFFFGREVERGRIIGNLRVSRFTLLYAQSGVGKSSLLSAGVAPSLRELAEQHLDEEGSAGYVPVVFRSWADDPIPGLCAAIEQSIEPFLAHDKPAPTIPRDGLRAAVEAATAATSSTLLLILDQFEEYFNYHATEGGGGTFPDQLAACVNRPDLRVNVLIAIREDAYSRIGDLLKGRIPSVYGNYLHLDYLDSSALRDSITKSIAEFNRLHPDDEPFALEPGLLDTVLDQVSAATQSQTGGVNGDAATPIDTAFVQLVMKRLWDEERAAGSRLLRSETLERLEGVATIIGTHLDTSMAKLPEAQQDVAAAAFRFLVTPDRAKIALGTKALSDWTGVPEPELDGVLAALAAPDLKILRPVVLGQRVDGRRFEIFHDGLAEPILSWRARHDDAELQRERASR